MRLDKYLKVSRIIKRRTVANEACDAGRVLVNDKIARASYDVKVGDKIENIDQAYKVLMQPNHPKMQMAEEFIKNHFNPNSGKK